MNKNNEKIKFQNINNLFNVQNMEIYVKPSVYRM